MDAGDDERAAGEREVDGCGDRCSDAARGSLVGEDVGGVGGLDTGDGDRGRGHNGKTILPSSSVSKSSSKISVVSLLLMIISLGDGIFSSTVCEKADPPLISRMKTISLFKKTESLMLLFIFQVIMGILL